MSLITLQKGSTLMASSFTLAFTYDGKFTLPGQRPFLQDSIFMSPVPQHRFFYDIMVMSPRSKGFIMDIINLLILESKKYSRV